MQKVKECKLQLKIIRNSTEEFSEIEKRIFDIENSIKEVKLTNIIVKFMDIL